MEKVLNECNTIRDKYVNLLGMEKKKNRLHFLHFTKYLRYFFFLTKDIIEIPLFYSPASSRSGKSGNLVLTQERLLFISRDKILRDIPLASIVSVEPHSYLLLVPGGIPCVKIETTQAQHLYGFDSSWNSSHLRSIWLRYLNDMISALKMAHDLKNPHIIPTAVRNLILSSALVKRHGRSAPPGYFQYFGECFPNNGWFRIPTIFQKRGNLLNIDNECEMNSIEDQTGAVLKMLQSAIQLIHMHKVDTPDYVDFKALKNSTQFSDFCKQTFLLQKVRSVTFHLFTFFFFFVV